MKKQANSQSGVTIVEVLVTILIISLIVAGAYATANRSTTVTQSSQERAEATKVAESQIDMVKASAAQNSDFFSSIGSYFCLQLDGDNIDIVSFPSGFSPADSPEDVAALTVGDTSGDYPASCVFQDRFYSYITYDEAISRFRAVVRWERFGGGSVEQIEVVYGVHQP